MTAETNYLADDQVAKLFDLVLQLASDLHVTAQRLYALEAVLARSGALRRGELDAFVPSDEESADLQARRDHLLRGLLDVLTESGPAEHPLRAEWDSARRREVRNPTGQ
jgi:hypothetical protein